MYLISGGSCLKLFFLKGRVVEDISWYIMVYRYAYIYIYSIPQDCLDPLNRETSLTPSNRKGVNMTSPRLGDSLPFDSLGYGSPFSSPFKDLDYPWLHHSEKPPIQGESTVVFQPNP